MKRFRYAKRAKRFTARQLQRGDHRGRVGGLWERAGKLQLDFMIEQGLKPDARFLDVACGALRAGIHFVDYLDPGNYYGIDINESLLEAGYEIDAGALARQVAPQATPVH